MMVGRYLKAAATKSLHRVSRLFGRKPIVGHLDTANSDYVQGWVIDRTSLGRAVEVEIVHDAVVIARGVASDARPDVVGDGHRRLSCGFRIPLPPQPRLRATDQIDLRDALTGRRILGGPFPIQVDPTSECFRDRFDGIDPTLVARFRRRAAARETVGFSIVMPVYHTPPEWLAEAIESVLGQWYETWELICVDDCSPDPIVRRTLDRYAAQDDRIKVVSMARNGGISAATNAGLAVARYAFIGFMDHDDVLEPNALLAMAEPCKNDTVDLVYSDEILTGEHKDDFLRFVARPSFSHDYYLSHPYFVHFIVCRKSIIDRAGGVNDNLTVSQDVDFVLRALECARNVAHVPQFLYRWRTHLQSTGHAKMDLVTDNTVRAITGSLSRIHPGCTVEPGDTFNTYRITWPAAGGKTLIVIPTKNAVSFLRAAVDSIEAFTDRARYELVIIDHSSDDPLTIEYLRQVQERHAVMPYDGTFNFSKMNNLAAERFGKDCRFIAFLNNDIEIVADGWLERLMSLAAREDVGAVGPMLVYDNTLVQHAGVIIGFHEAAEHVLKLTPAYLDRRRNPGYNATLVATRDFSAVTAACLLLRRDVFEEVGGFDEALDIGFNDTDLCLRIRDLGYKVLYDGDTVVKHHESATRSLAEQLLKHPDNTALFKRRWADLIRRGDPFYSPMLRLEERDHTIRQTAPEARQLRYRLGQAGFRRQNPA